MRTKNDQQPQQAQQYFQGQTPVQFFQMQPQPLPQQQARHQTIPGLKVAYGAMAAVPVQFGAPQFGAPLVATPKVPGLFARLKEGIINLVTEEADTDRPIGISRLSRKTFQAREEVAGNTIVRSGRGTQDYSFSQLTPPRR